MGGVCFRVDDNHTINEFKDYKKVFDKYGYKFILAINPSLSYMNDIAYINNLKEMQNDGIELADHTPNHHMLYFTVSSLSELENNNGIDHITGNKICLKYEILDYKGIGNEGKVDLINNLLIAKNKSEFVNDIGMNVYAVFIPLFNKLFAVKYYKNSSSDTLILKSIWGEDVSLGLHLNIDYKKMNVISFKPTREALIQLVRFSANFCKKNGLHPFQTYIQPGESVTGNVCRLKPNDVKEVYGDIFHYKAAGTYGNYSKKVFNEYDPDNLLEFNFNWADFQEDVNSFTIVKKIIAYRSARHYYSVGHSHFSGLLGGWSGYLSRMDSLLNWCKQKNIPVVTYSEMAKKLYYDKPNPYENVFPKLDVDLDDNGFPDGYNGLSGFDNNDGVALSSNKSLYINHSGIITTISYLGGIEKGDNDFIIYTKGGLGDSIKVTFSFDQAPLTKKTFVFPATTENWQKYSLGLIGKSLFIPDSISTITIKIETQNYKNGTTVKISGMELRKKTNSSIVPSWLQEPKIEKNKIILNWFNNEKEKDYNVVLQRKDKSQINYIDIATDSKGFTSYIDYNLQDSNTYSYRVKCITPDNQVAYSDSVTITYLTTSISDKYNLPSEYSLSQNYPNPFNPVTTINYSIPTSSDVKLIIYDLLGRKVQELVNEFQSSGNYSIQFNGDNLSSGIYFYALKSGDFYQVRKMILLK